MTKDEESSDDEKIMVDRALPFMTKIAESYMADETPRDELYNLRDRMLKKQGLVKTPKSKEGRLHKWIHRGSRKYNGSCKELGEGNAETEGSSKGKNNTDRRNCANTDRSKPFGENKFNTKSSKAAGESKGSTAVCIQKENSGCSSNTTTTASS